MKASIRALVRSRAARRCEYCRLHEDDLPLFSFHIEHILPKKHGGADDPKLLAWSCHFCNLAKSSNLSGRDTVTGPPQEERNNQLGWQSGFRPGPLRRPQWSA